MNEIVVISSYPERDIQEFITYFKTYIDKYKYPKLYLKDGHTLRFQSNNNLIGVRKHYYYSEIFKSYSRNCITTLQQETEQLNNIIHEIEEYTHERIKLYKKRLKFPFYHPMRTLHNIWLYERYLNKLKKYKGGVDNE